MKKKKSILITGGAGFLGSHIVDSLIRKHFNITIIDNLASTKHPTFVNPKADFIEIDINNKNLKKTLESINPEIIIHAASQISVSESSKNPINDAKINIIGSLNILESIKDIPECYFVFISSGGAIYGENIGPPVKENKLCSPESPYALSKLTVENYIKYYSISHKLKHLIVRPGNIFGPRQNPYGESGVVSIFTNLMLKKQRVSIYGDGSDYRDYIYVNDVVNFIEKALKKRISGVFNVGRGKSITTKKVFSDLSILLNYEEKPVYLPKREGDIKGITLNVQKAFKEIEWKPEVNFIQGLKLTISFFKSVNLNLK